MEPVLSERKMGGHALSKSKEQSLHVLRITRDCGGRDILSFA